MAVRIVLADDNPEVLAMLQAVLADEGFAVVGTAKDGVEAVALVERLRPTLVVLDVAMPRLNGLDAARELRTRCPHCRVIILSAHSTESLVKDAFRSGARGYVVKTDRTEDLLRGVREVAQGGIFLSPTASKYIVRPFILKSDDGTS